MGLLFSHNAEVWLADIDMKSFLCKYIPTLMSLKICTTMYSGPAFYPMCCAKKIKIKLKVGLKPGYFH